MFLPLREHRANAGVRILHVVHRIFVVFLHSQIDIKCVFGVGFAAEQEETHGIGAGPFDQIAQGHIAAGTLADLDFFTTPDNAYHGVQHVVGITFWDTLFQSLQAGAHPGDGAMVIGSLDVDGLGEAALPLGFVVSHVGHEVGVAAVALAHHPVLVITELGGA